MRPEQGLHLVTSPAPADVGQVTEPAEVTALENENFDHGGEDDEVTPNAEHGPEAVYSLIGRKCVALGLDFASRLFAQSIARAMAGELDEEMPYSAGPFAGPLDQSGFLAATWQSAFANGQANLLEQAIALVTGLAKTPELARDLAHQTPDPAVVQEQVEHPLPAPPYPDELTAREVEVLRLLATGLKNAELACRLYLSKRTVHAHLRSIYAKIGVNNRSAATRYAVLHGLAA
jgi:DNA-binding CsgD family transcriptional regulator